MDESYSNVSDRSDYESFHDNMDWYHVLDTHGNQREKWIAVPTVLEERIEEYIAEAFNPTFNEDVISSETLINMNVGNVAVALEEICVNFPKIMSKLARLLMPQILFFKGILVLRNFSWLNSAIFCDKPNVPHHVVDDTVNLLRNLKKWTLNSNLVC